MGSGKGPVLGQHPEVIVSDEKLRFGCLTSFGTKQQYIKLFIRKKKLQNTIEDKYHFEHNLQLIFVSLVQIISL